MRRSNSLENKALSGKSSTSTYESSASVLYLTEVKITSKLSDLKPLHASWIVDLYEHLKTETGMIIKGFDSRGITENSKSFSKSLNNAF